MFCGELVDELHKFIYRTSVHAHSFLGYEKSMNAGVIVKGNWNKPNHYK